MTPRSPGGFLLGSRACWRGCRLQPHPMPEAAMSCHVYHVCLRSPSDSLASLRTPAGPLGSQLVHLSPTRQASRRCPSPRLCRPPSVRRLATDSFTFEARQWGLKVSWQRLVPLCCRLAFAAPVGVLGLCALCWAIRLPAGAPFPFSPARAPARQRVHGAWAWGRGLPRLCAPRSGQAPVRRSAKPPS